MNLFYSSITSILIVGAVWFVALLQPTEAIAESFDPIKDIAAEEKSEPKQEPKLASVVKAKPSKTVSEPTDATKWRRFAGIAIVGNTQTTKLTELDSLISSFNANESVQAKLYKQPSKVFVYYRDFSSSYDSATITVGYNKKELVGPGSGVSLPATNYESLLKKGNYSDMDTVKAWQNINYRKNPQSVLEIHYFDKDGSMGKSELLVSYEQGA